MFGTWIPLTLVENSLGYQRSGFSGWNFYFAELGVSWFSGKLLGPLDTGPLGLTGTWILLTLVENSFVFLRSGFSGWNFLRFGA